MKIGLMHYSSPPIVGGVETVLAQHARLLNRAGHNVTIFTGRGKTFESAIPVRILPHLDSRNSTVMQVKRLLDRGEYSPIFDELREQIGRILLSELQGFDLLIAHNVASLHKNLPLTAALEQIYKLAGFPTMILWHHDLAWTTPRYRREMHNGYPWDLLRSRWAGATHVVISELRRQELSRLTGLSSATIHVIPNGVDLNSFYKLEKQTVQIMVHLKLLEADPLFLLPVRLTPRKNIELALSILSEIRHEFPNAMLLVTGPEGPHNPNNKAYKERLLTLRDALNLQGSAHFMAEVISEPLSDAVIADFYRIADALLFPSQEEGFGIPILEAAFSHIPVFCADIPVLHELGGKDVNYFKLVDDPQSISRLISNRLTSETTSRWARRARKTYSWDSIYERCIGPLIQEVVK
jgi:glycosyltransferase involved in cell wall biosynthesis